MNQKEQENKKYQDWLDEHPEERTLEEQILIDGGIHAEVDEWGKQLLEQNIRALTDNIPTNRSVPIFGDIEYAPDVFQEGYKAFMRNKHVQMPKDPGHPHYIDSAALVNNPTPTTTYNSLEEILEDVNHIYLIDGVKDAIQIGRKIWYKLQNTIDNGCYLKCDGTE